MKATPTNLPLTAFLIAITATFVTQSLRASAIDTLVITENSSTSLTATLNGTTPLSVTFNSDDFWYITLPGVGGAFQVWAEPGMPVPGFSNFVDTFAGPDLLEVTSEFFTSVPGLPDGTQDKTTFTLNGNPLYVTFFDKGDAATAPDTGTTASLFGLSLTGLAFLRRKLS